MITITYKGSLAKTIKTCFPKGKSVTDSTTEAKECLQTVVPCPYSMVVWVESDDNLKVGCGSSRIIGDREP